MLTLHKQKALNSSFKRVPVERKQNHTLRLLLVINNLNKSYPGKTIKRYQYHAKIQIHYRAT